ncbi:MAG: hypothetical protein HOP30_20620 [Cyclobacteriaceae bacterium]|nr:hypothetical protein [Cyclobacteriaceae bacterium]
MVIVKKDYAQMDNKFTASFANKSYLVNGKGPDQYISRTTILDLFELSKGNTDSIHLHFDANNNLVLTFKDSLGIQTKTMHGKFKRHFYYEVFIRNDKIEIPPLLPIIYGRHDIKRLRILLTKESELLIENKWVRDGNIFLLAGGGGGVHVSYFKQITERP